MMMMTIQVDKYRKKKLYLKIKFSLEEIELEKKKIKKSNWHSFSKWCTMRSLKGLLSK